MLYFVIAAILVIPLLVCLGIVFFGPKQAEPQYRGHNPTSPRLVSGVIAGILAVLFVIFTLAMSITTVGARAVGIETAFGKYDGTLPNGLHFIAPWANVEQFSTQVQYLDLDGTDGHDKSNVSVTYAGGGGGTVDATVRWRINKEGAEKLWQKYRTFENVRDQLVNSSAKDSFRVIIAKYSPTDARDGKNLRPIADAVEADLANTLADDGVVIDSVSIKHIGLDAKSQAALDANVKANADIERAKLEQKKAEIDAQTARLREKEGALTGPALVRYCLDLTDTWDVAKNGPLPATWNCLATGTPPQVMVNSK